MSTTLDRMRAHVAETLDRDGRVPYTPNLRSVVPTFATTLHPHLTAEEGYRGVDTGAMHGPACREDVDPAELDRVQPVDGASRVPTLATFVRDRLAEWLDGLGHDITDVGERDGFPCLTVETWDGATWDDVAVTADGRTMSMIDGWREVRLRGFVWHAEPTDTGHVHGPDLPTFLDRTGAYTGPMGDRPGNAPGHRVPGTTRTV
jgi:hypothetical protein